MTPLIICMKKVFVPSIFASAHPSDKYCTVPNSCEKKPTAHSQNILHVDVLYNINKGNNKITELRTILQRESQNS